MEKTVLKRPFFARFDEADIWAGAANDRKPPTFQRTFALHELELNNKCLAR